MKRYKDPLVDNCIYCKKDFIKISILKYCSLKCKLDYLRKAKVTHKTPKKTRYREYNLICHNCECKFKTFRASTNFCSNSCRNVYFSLKYCSTS